MKFFKWFFGIFIAMIAVVYIVLFTGLGNSFLKPIIEKKIQEQTNLDSKLEVFTISTSYIEILLILNDNNTIKIKGDYSLFSQSFNLDYFVNLEELKTLQPLTQMQLNNAFHTDGNIAGDMALLNVEGRSDFAKSTTTYSVELTNFNPTSIIAKVDKLDVKTLLDILNQKAYASAKLDLDINFRNISPHQLDGTISLLTTKGVINSKVMKNDFKVSIPKTSFHMKLDANLKGDDLNYAYKLSSNLAKISSHGKIVPEPLAMDLKYALNVSKLEVLKPIIGADLRGSLHLNGEVKGTKEKLKVSGYSDFASSKTTFLAVLKEFVPVAVQANIKNLKIQKALYMLKQPHYTDGLFSLNVDIKNADVKNLQGSIKSKITQGILDSKYITKTYEFKSLMPKTIFNATTFTSLNKNIIDTKVDFNSNIATLDVKKARFNLDTTSLETDYKVHINNLDKLYFATQRHLKGSILAVGELKKAKDLDFTMHSNVAGGKLDATLHNDDFHAELHGLQTLKVLDMLIYPEVFKSNIDGVVTYNLAKAKGTFTGKLINGSFVKNQVLDLAKKYAHVDMYKEHFKGDVSAVINKDKILASLALHSNKSSIITKNTKLNSRTKQIDSKIEITANNNPFTVTLKGNAESPKVGVNADKLIKREASKAVEKQAKKLFKKWF